ncbi:MAG: AIM24 family protein [Gemmatimonadaceae bacterium]
MQADEIDFQVIGDDLQGVIVTLDPGEAVVAEAGAMMFMQDGIRMATTLDQTGRGGGRLVDKLFAAGKRMLSGDSFFVTIFYNESTQRRDVAFASPFPGKIQPIDLKAWRGEIIAQEGLVPVRCARRGRLHAFTKRIGAGFFGGEGFILQRLTGDGVVFLHASGTLYETTLTAGEVLRVDTGCLVAMQSTVSYDIQMVPGIKTALFGVRDCSSPS